MRVLRSIRTALHLISMGGLMSDQAINYPPPPWMASVRAKEGEDGNSLPRLGAINRCREELWLTSFEASQNSLRMASIWNVLHRTRFELWIWASGLQGTNARIPFGIGRWR